jgi:hypothetical protein
VGLFGIVRNVFSGVAPQSHEADREQGADLAQVWGKTNLAG